MSLLENKELDEEEIIEFANNIPDLLLYCELQSKLAPIITIKEKDSVDLLDISYSPCFSLSVERREQIFNLFESTMKPLYISSGWGYDKKKKLSELFHHTSKFLLLTNPIDDSLVGHCMFRFEWDDEDEPTHPVLYLYECQINPNYHKQKLGNQLMNYIIEISEKLHLWKVMLTCFKENHDAMSFYHKIGFGVDIYSPSRCMGYESSDGRDDVCYEILSNKPNLK
eukprot:gene5356-7430_t